LWFTAWLQRTSWSTRAVVSLAPPFVAKSNMYISTCSEDTCYNKSVVKGVVMDQPEMNVTVDPNKTPVYAVDTYLIGSNEHVLTLNFAQAVVGSNQQNIVSRVSMTTSQAKEFLKNLSDHIEKFEV
jgi:hypothetical protein